MRRPRLYRAYLNELEQNGQTRSGWRVGVGKWTEDGVLVTPATKAAAALFTYTPYAGAQWGGNQPQWGGTYLFHYFWKAFGFDSAVPALAAPSGLTARPTSTSQITLSWNATAGATGYRLERATTSSGPWSVIATLPAQATGYEDGGLSGDTIYFYRVAAYYQAGASPYSATVSARPADAARPVISPLDPSDYFFSQSVGEWADKDLGGVRGVKIRDYGCALTSLAMLLKSYRIDTNPLDLNKGLTDLGRLMRRVTLKIGALFLSTHRDGWNTTAR
jgi:hypothetical protein